MFPKRARYVPYLVVAVGGIVLLACLTIWLTISAARTGQEHAKALVLMFGGEKSLETVRNPTRVGAYRLGALRAGVSSENAILSDYPITAGPVAVPAAIGSDLSQALCDERSYLWEAAKGCGAPRYGVRITFHRADSQVDILFCFECDILMVAHDGAITGGEDFDSIRPILVRCVKTLFPADGVIQSVPGVGTPRAL